MCEITRSERLVLEKLCEGKTAGQIAEELYVSKRTVDFHVRNMTQKVGTHTRHGLVAYALSRGIIDPAEIREIIPGEGVRN